METNNESNELTALREVENKADVIIDKTRDIIEKSESLKDMVTEVSKSFENIYIVNAQINGKLMALKTMSDHNLAKFKDIVSGAEKRLDHQLNMLDMLTEKLISCDLSSMNEADIMAQQTLMELIQKANDRFNNEIEKLYLL